MRTVSMVVVALLAGCPSDEDDGGGGGGLSSYDHPKWLMATWDHDEGREGYADYADYSITFNADGTYDWDYAVSYLDGEWRYPGYDSIYLDNVRHDLDASKGCRVITLNGKTYLSHLATVTGCPTTPAYLTALEKCLVGTFTAGTPNGGSAYYKFEADRTMTDFYDDPGYTSGGSSYTRFGEFKLLANGDIEMVQPGGDPEVRVDVETLVNMRRSGAVAAGCDMTSFTKLGNPGGGGGGGGGTCSMSCGTGYTCSEYAGVETCCGSAYPYYCPDVHACFATAAARDTACGTSYYGDPDFGCAGSQVSVAITGATGSYCAPPCNGTGSFCPSAVNNKVGTCAIRYNGSTVPDRCVLRCTDVGVTGGECPHSMTCTTAGTSAYCLFK